MLRFAAVVTVCLVATLASIEAWGSLRRGSRAACAAGLSVMWLGPIQSSSSVIANAADYSAGGRSSMVIASANDYKSESAVKNVARVYYSLGNVYDDIEKNGADASTVRKSVIILQDNYKLRDNIRKTLDDIDGKKREEAYTHGLSCIEDLALISEYFEDSIDDATGKKSPAKETLQLAEKAVVAARTELETFLGYVPYGKSTLASIKQDEFSY